MSKYGQLFTEDDVLQIVRLAFDAGANARVSNPSVTDLHANYPAILRFALERAELRFPADEPVFVLRGQDKAAMMTLNDYAYSCRSYNCSQEHLDAIRAAYDRFDAFQETHPERMKIPD